MNVYSDEKILKKMREKKDMQNQKETVDILGAHDEESWFKEFDPHRTY